MLETILWIIWIVLGGVIGLPLLLVVGLCVFYLLLTFFTGIAVIPVAIASRIAGNESNKEEESKE